MLQRIALAPAACLFLSFFAGIPPAAADDALLHITKAASPIRVDGVLDEPAWQQAAAVDLPYEIRPGDNTPAPVRTKCFLLYDDRNFYFAFVAEDSTPSEIRAHVTDRDPQQSQDDEVAVIIDTFNDGRRGFEFFVNPVGVQMDIALNDLNTENTEDMTWDAIWSSAGRITAEGYVVEAAIPFTSLRFPRQSGAQTWGFLAFRNYPRSVRHQITSVPFDRNRSCMACQLGKLTGFEGITPGRSFELDPTLTGRRNDLRPAQAGTLVNDQQKTDTGLSLRWAATPNVSVNGALNPDFSQIEADAAQLNVNTRFALFYQEKRPFFLEGADLFQTPLQAVYTRTVADAIWGAKVTGKAASRGGGLFVTRDDQNNLTFPSNQGTGFASLETHVVSSVVRLRQDVGQTSTVGVLATDREGGGYRNTLGGADGVLHLTKTESISFQALETSTRYPDSLAVQNAQPLGAFKGFGGWAEFDHATRNWTGWLRYQDLEKNFRSDAGFIPRVDIRETHAQLSHNWWGGPNAFLTQSDLGVEASYIEDHQGTPTDRLVAVFADLNGPLMSYFQPRYERKMERFQGKNYEEDWMQTRFGSRPSDRLNTWCVVSYGDAIDYENPRRANRWWGGPGFSYDFGRHFQFFLDHTFERLDTGSRRIYTANLLQSRIVYQFNVRTFVRAVLQYTDLDRNTAAYAAGTPSGDRTLFTQLLASYKVNPQTVFYLGYSDQREGVHPKDMRIQERTFFAKVGYAWLL